jgi:hypothetical protein
MPRREGSTTIAEVGAFESSPVEAPDAGVIDEARGRQRRHRGIAAVATAVAAATAVLVLVLVLSGGNNGARHSLPLARHAQKAAPFSTVRCALPRPSNVPPRVSVMPCITRLPGHHVGTRPPVVHMTSPAHH